MKKIHLTFFLILFFSLNFSWAQKYYTRNYNINSGLPCNCINDIFKDNRGFLWIGTNAGLSRFNGSNFKNYTSQDGLIGDKVNSICEGENGDIWVACYNAGLTKINGDKLFSYNSNSGIISNSIVKLHYSKRTKTLFIGTEDGLTIYNEKIGFKSFHEKENNTNHRLQITDFIESNESTLIFTNGNGVFKYIPETNSLFQSSFGKHTYNSINKVFISNQNLDTLISFNRINLEIVDNNRSQLKERFGPISNFIEDSEGNIWFTTYQKDYWNNGGIYRYNNKGIASFTDYLDINTENILSIAYDKTENILWLGTKDDGLYLYPLTNFSYYNSDYFGLKEINIQDLLIDDEKLYIATKKELIIKKGEKITTISFDTFQSKFQEFVKTKIKNKYQYLIDKNGSYEKYQILIQSKKYAFSNPYINIVDDYQNILPAKSLYKPLKYDILTNKKLREIKGVYKDNRNNIWVGSNVGIFKIVENTIKYYDLENDQFSRFIFNDKNELLASDWDELYIYPDIENSNVFSKFNHFENNSPININKIKKHYKKTWFLSTDHGAFRKTGNTFNNTFNLKGFENVSFNDLCFDQYGNTLLAGVNGVIYIVNNSNQKLISQYQISNKNGLLGSSVRWVKCTKDDILFAGTNSGINIIDLKKLYTTGFINIKTLDKSLGFTDYAGNISIVDSTDNLWIGSNKNLVKIDLKQLKFKNNQSINFLIKSIYVNDEKYDLDRIEDRDIWTNIPKSSIKLPYYKNSITFYFDVIHYLTPDKISFSYILDGTKKEWSPISTEKKIIFQNLRPGNYRLRIKAFNNNEQTANQELFLNFTINPPIWGRWYSIVLATLTLILLVWLIIFLRTRSIKRKERLRAEISERITEFEMKALRSQMNPHFIFNAINSIQNFMLDNDIDEALNYLSDFAKLIRLTLDNVSKKSISIEDELDYLKYYLSLEKMRFDKKFDVQISVPDELSYQKITIPPMIIQPYVENSIKHGFIKKIQNATIKLTFEIANENFLKCTIEDNGIGRTKSKELNKNNKTHKSRGTFITNERLALLNQTQQKKGYKIETTDLYDEFGLASGTKVEIYIPL
ncbi:MAG: histidine kinase [Bacteroidales bacterium]|nr:histidine kinase [Bacteroidales bacterium]